MRPPQHEPRVTTWYDMTCCVRGMMAAASMGATAFQKAMTQVLKTYRVMPSTTAPKLLPKFG